MEVKIDNVTVNVVNITVSKPMSETKTDEHKSETTKTVNEDDIPEQVKVIDSFTIDL